MPSLTRANVCNVMEEGDIIPKDSVRRFAPLSGPSQRLLRPRKRELVSVGPLPLPVSGGGHAFGIVSPSSKPDAHVSPQQWRKG